MYIFLYILYFVVNNLKILLLTIHHYFLFITFVKTSNFQHEQSTILNYVLVLVLVADIAGGKEAEGVWEQGVEENIWT
jgi:hypothetical protein